MSLNTDFEYFIYYLTSPFSNLLANFLTRFHLSNSWAKYRTPDAGKVFTVSFVWERCSFLIARFKFSWVFITFRLVPFHPSPKGLSPIYTEREGRRKKYWDVAIETKAVQENRGTPHSNISWTCEEQPDFRGSALNTFLNSKSCQNPSGNHQPALRRAMAILPLF